MVKPTPITKGSRIGNICDQSFTTNRATSDFVAASEFANPMISGALIATTHALRTRGYLRSQSIHRSRSRQASDGTAESVPAMGARSPQTAATSFGFAARRPERIGQATR